MPRLRKGPADAPVPPHSNGVVEPTDADPPLDTEANGISENRLALPAPGPGPLIEADPGLYAVLGLDPSVSDDEIQTTYRRQAARVHGGEANAIATLRQLNVAYEVLGNHVRRVDYDRQRLSQVSSPGLSSPVRPGVKSATPATRRRRPRYIVQPRYAGLPDVLVVLTVVGLAVLAGFLLIPRLSFNLSALNVLQNVLPLSSARKTDANATALPTARAPTPTVRPGIATRYVGSAASVSDANPAQNADERVTLKVRRDGQPAVDVDAWAIVHYSTTDERWPASGSVKTDSTGTATIVFNVGHPVPGRTVTVDAFAQTEDPPLSWSTTFTPR